MTRWIDLTWQKPTQNTFATPHSDNHGKYKKQINKSLNQNTNKSLNPKEKKNKG